MAVSLFHDTSPVRYFVLFFILNGFVYKCYCHNGHDQKDIFRSDLEKDTSPVKDFVLCRNCGADIASAGFIINKISPEAVITGNQTIFETPGVSIQQLVNLWGIKFHTITLSKASCFGAAEHWTKFYSWYPGYAWKPCLCRHCSQQLGWMFEPIETATPTRLVPSENGFYVLILDSLLSEKYSLIVIPKSYRS
ncbi:protein cereblon-like isoform X2 [Venturia canescens]|uniref:protein cereblon-like isoform X2 n=1 Tax=Venturia canescens TaxID=32260 RepID=UPI001C9C5110|nr:protein cereblon-like isoform X2 [Venturia canescens]